MSFLLKLSDLRAETAIDAEGYRCGLTAFLHYRDGVAGAHLNNDGLGLASAYSVVRRHGGLMRVDSAPGEKTTFYVYLRASPGISQVPST